jgi:hypothetical protein
MTGAFAGELPTGIARGVDFVLIRVLFSKPTGLLGEPGIEKV